MNLTATRPQPAGDLVMSLTAEGTITAAHVLKLRWEVFGDGVVDRSEAEILFNLNDSCKNNDPAWNDFFVDSLTDYFVWQQSPKGYLSETDAQFLIERVNRDGRIDGLTEMELLVNIVHWSRQIPEELLSLTLSAVKDSVLQGGGVLFGHSRRRPNVIDTADVEILRRLIYAGGGGGGHTITRREADMLFDLNSATVTADNAESWRDLFVRAIASHMMFPMAAPSVPGIKEVERRRAWLRDRRGVGRLLSEMGGAIVRGNLAETWCAADMFGKNARLEAEEKQRRVAAEAHMRESIDEAEAMWLAERIGEDRLLDDNEKALLAFIKQNSPSVHASLNPLFERAGV